MYPDVQIAMFEQPADDDEVICSQMALSGSLKSWIELDMHRESICLMSRHAESVHE